MQKKTTSWGKVAGWYDEMLGDSDTYQEKVILPNLTRLLQLKRGLRVLDLACGQGYFSRAFAAKGAGVTGADISPELIKKAREHSPKEINYLVAPADKLTGLKEKSFDAVTIVLALQNIQNLDGTLAECRRVLDKCGRLLLVLNHPAFRIPKKSEWGFDEKTQMQYRRVDAYLAEAHANIQMPPRLNAAQGRVDRTNSNKFVLGKSGGVTTASFHRPLQLYVKALAKNGFAVTRLEEWISHRTSEPGPRAAAEDKARKEIPLFLFLEATAL
ncbi:MAG: class I SAM-dependent methyltransferase [Patescibacteria group bacterium]